MSGNQGGAANVEQLMQRVHSLEQSQSSIANSLTQLVRLEERHLETRGALERAFHAIKENRERIDQVDAQVPDRLGERLERLEAGAFKWNLTSGWVIAATLGCVLLVLGALGKLAMQAGAREQAVLPERRIGLVTVPTFPVPR